MACWNFGGAGSPFALFYLYVATLAAYFASRRQTLFACASVTVAAGLPLLYDHQHTLTQRLFERLLVSTMATALALVLQHQRERVRRTTAQAHALALQNRPASPTGADSSSGRPPSWPGRGATS